MREKLLQANAVCTETLTPEENEEYSLFTIQNARDGIRPLILTMALNSKVEVQQ